jgi:hypothetical protein
MRTVDDILSTMAENEITLKEVIDGFIEHEHIIGVGLITLREQLTEMVNSHLK